MSLACQNGRTSAVVEVADVASPDASVEIKDASVVDAPPDRGSPTKLGVTTQTSVIDGRWWPESGKGGKRLGYLRHGAVVDAFDKAQPNSDCKEGWYELEVGGYVCGKAVSAELSNPKVRLAPKQPDHDAGMPYRYGVNVSDDTPLYRRVLPMEDRKKYEPWLSSPKVVDSESAGEEKSEGADDENPSVMHRPESRESKEKAASADAGRPKLKELKGRGVLVRKMSRGFYIALDKEFRSYGARWWRTSFGFAAPFERIMLQPGVTKYAGTWFDLAAKADVEWPATEGTGDTDDVGSPHDAGDPHDAVESSVVNVSATDAAARVVTYAGTVAFVSVGFARKIELVEDKNDSRRCDLRTKKVVWGPELPKRSAVLLTGREAVVSGQRYHETRNGYWVRLIDLKTAHPAPPPDLSTGEKWIDVDLTRQALVAFEGTRPVFATLISSGRRNAEDKEKDFPTPVGIYRIREKHVTTTMDGDVASDGPYSIEDVPWVMYFQGSYALHGAFWHDQFGHMRSHGCVNMSPEDARTVFAWSEPQLPTGWHGVFSKDERSGTRIVVHEDKPAKR